MQTHSLPIPKHVPPRPLRRRPLRRRPLRRRPLRRASAGVAVTALTAVAKAVTPTVVPIVVPTALMHQNSTITMAAMVWANSFRANNSRCIIGDKTARLELSSPLDGRSASPWRPPPPVRALASGSLEAHLQAHRCPRSCPHPPIAKHKHAAVMLWEHGAMCHA